MSSARASFAGAVVCAALAVALAFPQPDLRPVMPEVDGVHPARALQALRNAFTPGRGFLDKYPPLGSWLFGLAAAAGDSAGLLEQADAITSEPPAARRARTWPLRDEVQAALERQRWLSRLAAGGCAALVFLLARRLAGAAGGAASLGPLLAAAAFAASTTLRFQAGSVNVDALALLPALLALHASLARRWWLAGTAVALAVALKDPQVVLVPVVLAGAAALGGRRALLHAGLAAAWVYALTSGALTSPSTWWRHLEVTAGGLEHVSRADPAVLSDWGRLLGRIAALLGEGGPAVPLAAGGLLAAPLLLRRARGPTLLVLAGALAPVAFALAVGYAYARFLLVPQALLAVLLGSAAGAVAGGLIRFPARGAALLALVLLLARPGPDPAADARARLPAALDGLGPGGRVLLFADEREHGPPLDPSRWELDARGLNEVVPVLAALRERPVDERPEVVVVMAFPTDPPSGAAPAEDTPPRVGDRLAGLYVVAEVLGGEPPDWTRRAIAVSPRITLLERAGE